MALPRPAGLDLPRGRLGWATNFRERSQKRGQGDDQNSQPRNLRLPGP